MGRQALRKKGAMTAAERRGWIKAPIDRIAMQLRI